MLDTTALIDFSKGHEPSHTRILAMIEAGDDVGVCAVIVAEFYAGLPPETAPVWDALFAALSFWDTGRQAAMQAGRDRYELARRGRTVAVTDALIAATARQYGATVITTNAKDFPWADLRLLSPWE